MAQRLITPDWPDEVDDALRVLMAYVRQRDASQQVGTILWHLSSILERRASEAKLLATVVEEYLPPKGG